MIQLSKHTSSTATSSYCLSITRQGHFRKHLLSRVSFILGYVEIPSRDPSPFCNPRTKWLT